MCLKIQLVIHPTCVISVGHLQPDSIEPMARRPQRCSLPTSRCEDWAATGLVRACRLPIYYSHIGPNETVKPVFTFPR
jgi:hypothetical protein